MASKYLNTMLYQLKEAFGRKIGMIDYTGYITSPGNPAEIDANVSVILSKCEAADGNVVHYLGYSFLPVETRGKLEFVSFVEGEDASAAKFAEILTISIDNMRQFYDDKFDKTNFVKNIIMDNILPGDVFVKSKELHLAYEASRVVLVVRKFDKKDLDVFDVISGIFPENNRDFVIDLDGSTIVLVKEMRDGMVFKDVEKMARSIVDTLQSEAMVNVIVGIGTVASNIRDIARSFKEANIAIEVGRVFDNDKRIVNYENLGIGRLIYQLPTTLCELFLSEVFKKDSIDSLDQETLFTIQKFFDNNLNVSETSRQLYVHRNTLVYRLDKVQKITGLDLRIFDHAIVFKVAMMVKKYLMSNPSKM